MDLLLLYVVLDIFSRYVVGWMLATREAAELAERLLADSIRKQGVERDQLTIHADQGSSMSSILMPNGSPAFAPPSPKQHNG